MHQEIKGKQVLTTAKIIAVVGVSSKQDRPSYEVAQYLMENGYQVILINPVEKGNTILGQLCYESLIEASRELPQTIDIVDCFRRSDAIPEIVSEAIGIGAKCIWMQEGIINEDAAKQAQDAGLTVIMDLCTKKSIKNCSRRYEI